MFEKLRIDKRRIAQLCILLVLMQLFFSAAMVLVYCIPTHLLDRHVEASCLVFDAQGTWERTIPSVESTRMDKYTDGIMLGEAVYHGNGNPIEEAFRSYYNIDTDRVIGDTPNYWLKANFTEDIRYLKPYQYSRYWHGYLVVLKPALIVLNYQGILILNNLIQTILACVLIVKCLSRYGKLTALAIGVALFLITPISVSLTLQYTWVYLIAVIGCLVALRFGTVFTERGLWPFFFMVIGGLTTFFDLLTYPTYTLCLPLLVSLMEIRRIRTRLTLSDALLAAISWLIGFAVTWVSKWVIASVVLQENCFPFDRLSMRSSNEVQGESFTFGSVIQRNLSVFNNAIYPLLIACIVFYLLLYTIRNHDSIRFSGYDSLVFISVAFMPIIWMFITKNHAYIHYWMTYKNMACIPAAIILAFAISFTGEGSEQQSGVMRGKHYHVGR